MKNHVYIGEFSCWDDVKDEFEIDLPEPDNVFAFYDCQAYDGSADVFFENNGVWKYVSGSHCSCYGLEGQWESEEDFDPSVYLAAIRQGKNTNPLGDKDIDAKFREFLELATGAGK